MSDPGIESITPIFVGMAQKQASSIRDAAGCGRPRSWQPTKGLAIFITTHNAWS